MFINSIDPRAITHNNAVAPRVPQTEKVFRPRRTTVLLCYGMVFALVNDVSGDV